MTWWETPEWAAYERAAGVRVSRLEELRCSTRTTQVIDLAPPEDKLWRAVRKSYRSLITKHIDAIEHVHPAEARAFATSVARPLHIAHVGRETRPAASWAVMGELAAAGTADFWVSRSIAGTGAVVGYIFVVTYDGWNYYHSAVTVERNVGHALLWAAIRAAKRHGDRTFEVGWLAQDGDSEKEKAISFFKSGFGGCARPANYLLSEAKCHAS